MAVASQGRFLGAAALVRFDAELAARIREGRDLAAINLSAALTITVGSSAYGAVFGLWHSPQQALYAAVKLPVVLMVTVVASLGAGAALAAVIRSGLSGRQSFTLLSTTFASMAALLGGLAPVVALFVLQSPPPDPSWVGLAHSDPQVQAGLAVHHRWLLTHVAVIASCALLGLWRLRRILAEVLGPDQHPRTVWLAWLLVAGSVGAELSWLARPFQGTPTLAPSLFRSEPLAGNFFESVWRMVLMLWG